MLLLLWRQVFSEKVSQDQIPVAWAPRYLNKEVWGVLWPYGLRVEMRDLAGIIIDGGSANEGAIGRWAT